MKVKLRMCDKVPPPTPPVNGRRSQERTRGMWQIVAKRTKPQKMSTKKQRADENNGTGKKRILPQIDARNLSYISPKQKSPRLQWGKKLNAHSVNSTV